ncbi:LOW QUALITY PROTEIN: trace amine-associated receptor 5 [Phaethornis superciliosus]
MLVTLCYQANGSCYRTLHHFVLQLAIYLACALGMLITVLGNLLVIVVISHFKALHTPTNLLLLSLALADFLLGLTVLPFSTIQSVESCWYFGDDFCRLHTFLDLFCLNSIFHLCFISINRHSAICNPLLCPTKFTIRVACIYIGGAVLMAYTSVFLYIKATEEGLGHFLQDMPSVGSCQLLFNKPWVFPVFFFPCLIIIVLCVTIFIVAKKQTRVINNMNRGIGSQLHVGVSKSERKEAKILGVAVGVYLLCWLPFTIETMVDSLLDFVTPVLFDILIWFAYFNSACNPLIYVFSYRFRKAPLVPVKPGASHPKTPPKPFQAARPPRLTPGARRAGQQRGPASPRLRRHGGTGQGGDGNGTGPVCPSPPCRRRRRPPRPVRAGSSRPGKGSGISAGAPERRGRGSPGGRSSRGGVRPGACQGGGKGLSELGTQRPRGLRWGRGRPHPPGEAVPPGLGRREGGDQDRVTGGEGVGGVVGREGGFGVGWVVSPTPPPSPPLTLAALPVTSP